MSPLAWVKRRLARRTLLVEFCHRCGRRQPLVWWADDALWHRVTGWGRGGVLCPRCFDQHATKLGLLLTWRPTLDDHP